MQIFVKVDPESVMGRPITPEVLRLVAEWRPIDAVRKLREEGLSLREAVGIMRAVRGEEGHEPGQRPDHIKALAATAAIASTMRPW